MSVGLITDEPGRFYTFQSTLPAGEYFEFRPRNPPLNSKPIVDDESGMCIGYSVARLPVYGRFMMQTACLLGWKKRH
ncbi:hypothetical protein ACGE9R_001993 [Enterobacter hormaechei]|nr:Uncharacterised protein [Enterobacter hormaechei]VAK89602.1 Uncharacterised protein [Enterobacter hormaechei]